MPPAVNSSKGSHDSDFGIDGRPTSKSIFDAALEAVLEGIQCPLPAVGVPVQVVLPAITPAQLPAAPQAPQVPGPVCGLGPLAAAPLAPMAATALALVAQAMLVSPQAAQAVLGRGGKACAAKKYKKKYKETNSGKRLVKH